MLQVAPVHARVHVAPSSHRIAQSPLVHLKSHVFPSVHVQLSPQSFAVDPSGTGVPDDDVVPLDDAVPLLLVVPPELLDDELGAPLPIVQSYEHAPATRPTTAITDMTEKRFTPSV
jgi:hypothetical protein